MANHCYGDQPALDRVDLRVPEGSVYVLVGANGAGYRWMPMPVFFNI